MTPAMLRTSQSGRGQLSATLLDRADDSLRQRNPFDEHLMPQNPPSPNLSTEPAQIHAVATKKYARPFLAILWRLLEDFA